MTTREKVVALTDCPPAEASAASGDVYRCCKSSPPSDNDMKTHEETGRMPDADPCLHAGQPLQWNVTIVGPSGPLAENPKLVLWRRVLPCVSDSSPA